MTSFPPSCPCCGQATQRLLSQSAHAMAYCGSCGWNISRARALLALRRRGMVTGLIFFVVVVSVLSASSPNPRNSLEDGLILIALLGVLATAVWRKLSRDSRALDGFSAGARGANSRQRTVPQPDARTLADFEHVRSLACPRHVQLNPATRSARILVRILPAGMFLWGIHGLLRPNRPISLAGHGPIDARLGAMFVLGCGVVLWFLLPRGLENNRQRGLLKHGEVALGRVTAPLVHSAGTPGIMYEFTDSDGRVVQGRGADIPGTLNEDNYVLVLYDPQNSHECLPLCATNYEFSKS